MELDTCELIWLRQLIQELKMRGVDTKTFIYDNHVSLHITSNAVFHERAKHIEINCHVTGRRLSTDTSQQVLPTQKINWRIFSQNHFEYPKLTMFVETRSI